MRKREVVDHTKEEHESTMALCNNHKINEPRQEVLQTFLPESRPSEGSTMRGTPKRVCRLYDIVESSDRTRLVKLRAFCDKHFTCYYASEPPTTLPAF